MKRARGEDDSNSVDRISELPQGILQQILYHLSQEEAVRTSVLSKSWRYNWCTRPNLDFSDRSFFKGSKQYFLSVVDETLQRYRDQRLCIEEFHLSISLDDSDPASASFLEKWIPTLATTNKGMKKFCLSIRSEQGSGSTHPPSVVFEAELLQDLHFDNLTLDRKVIDRIILFKHLKTLHLLDVRIEAEIFQKIISRCPMIETLHVEDCRGLRKIEVNELHCLKDLYFIEYDLQERDEECCSIEVYPPSLETIKVSCGNLRFNKGAVLCNLKHLYLRGVEMLLHRLSSCKFPSLERLIIGRCDGLRGIKLFMDAPNIVDFSYNGFFIPSISFASTSIEWKSRIYLRLRDAPSLCALCVCRPRNIGSYHRISLAKEMECVLKILMERESGDDQDDQLRQLWLQDLEEVRMEIYDTEGREYHPTTLSELPNYEEDRYNRIRFALKWRQRC
ncbi:PREDICTED: F-box/LRR-repeat protein 13-like [Erythranthe guttata]|uniref:F-box/LRR-repeat protein 13-like n=1 Tax=Erythranthe guttata TaxID=4155 RepID=UPI00064DC9E4|nr:PREDICTED: F-box/LRR-repeat protein 13-like [Erythranthe guttata]|eukprot:XP_012845997.1 PREDICTED: F-box/LRR-repeat protein 13-like [Erythranthe guttata]